MLQRGIVNLQRGVVTAPRLVAGLHRGKVFLGCPEQRERRGKICSQCVIPLDIQHKATTQRPNNEIHQAKVSRLPLAAACIRSISFLHLPPKATPWVTMLYYSREYLQRLVVKQLETDALTACLKQCLLQTALPSLLPGSTIQVQITGVRCCVRRFFLANLTYEPEYHVCPAGNSF